MFDLGEARTLLDSIDISKLIGLMVYSFVPRRGGARHGGRGCLHAEPPALVRLREKGGRRRVPCYPTLQEYRAAYLDGADLREDPKGPLFRAIGQGTVKLLGDKANRGVLQPIVITRLSSQERPTCAT